MKQYAGSRKVVIIQNPGKGNIEQAIFIIKRDVKPHDDDYIISEAKKIVNDFAKKNACYSGRLGLLNIMVASLSVIAVGVAAYVLFFM